MHPLARQLVVTIPLVFAAGCAMQPTIPDRIELSPGPQTSVISSPMVKDARPETARTSSRFPVANGQLIRFADDLVTPSPIAVVAAMLTMAHANNPQEKLEVQVERAAIEVYLREDSILPKHLVGVPIVMSGGIPIPVVTPEVANRIGAFSVLKPPPSSLATNLVIIVRGERFEHRTETQIESTLTAAEVNVQFRHTVEMALRKAGLLQ